MSLYPPRRGGGRGACLEEVADREEPVDGAVCLSIPREDRRGRQRAISSRAVAASAGPAQPAAEGRRSTGSLGLVATPACLHAAAAERGYERGNRRSSRGRDPPRGPRGRHAELEPRGVSGRARRARRARGEPSGAILAQRLGEDAIEAASAPGAEPTRSWRTPKPGLKGTLFRGAPRRLARRRAETTRRSRRPSRQRVFARERPTLDRGRADLRSAVPREHER